MNRLPAIVAGTVKAVCVVAFLSRQVLAKAAERALMAALTRGGSGGT